MRSWPLFAMVVVACGGGGGDAPVDAAVDAAPLCTHVQNLRTLHGAAQTFGAQLGRPFPGMVCIEGRSDIECATPAADKSFALCAPTGDFGLAFVHPDFEPTVYLHGPAAFAPPGAFSIWDNLSVDDQIWTPAGGTYPPTTNDGNLIVLVRKPVTQGGLADAEVALLPSAGLTIRYTDAIGRPSNVQDRTSESGIVLVPNAPVGDYDIQINSQTHPNCAFATGGYASPDITQDARVKVIAGKTVVVTMECSE